MRAQRAILLSVELFEDRTVPSMAVYPDRGPEFPPGLSASMMRPPEQTQHAPMFLRDGAHSPPDPRLAAMDVDRSGVEFIIHITVAPSISPPGHLPGGSPSSIRDSPTYRSPPGLAIPTAAPILVPVEPITTGLDVAAEVSRHYAANLIPAAITTPVSKDDTFAFKALPISSGGLLASAEGPTEPSPSMTEATLPLPRLAPAGSPPPFDPLEWLLWEATPVTGPLGLDLPAIEQGAQELLDSVGDIAVALPDESLLESYGYPAIAAVFVGWGSYAIWAARHPRRVPARLAGRTTFPFVPEDQT